MATTSHRPLKVIVRNANDIGRSVMISENIYKSCTYSHMWHHFRRHNKTE
jgi:hypothetical protein